MDHYKNLIDNSFLKAENLQSKITQDIINLVGMTGIKTRHFYNNLLNTDDARYLEVGTWKGSSVCSAMYGNKATFIEENCFHIDISKFPKFNIYLYDGNHSAASHFLALDHYYNCLDDIFIFMVDDWNWSYVRDGTKQSIEHLKLKVLYEKEIRLTNDNSHTPQPLASQTWWNGLYIAILQKTK
jgi:hypothetical protein